MGRFILVVGSRKLGALVALLVVFALIVGCAALREAKERRDKSQTEFEDKEKEVATAEATGAPEEEVVRLKGELAAAKKERDQAKEEVVRVKAEGKEDVLGWFKFIGPSVLALAGIRLPKAA